MRKNILQHIGAIVSGKRNEEHLTQQQLAQQRTPAYPEHRKGEGQCVRRSPCRCDLPAWLVGRCFVLPGYAQGGTANEAVIMQVRGLHGGGESISTENRRLHGRADAQPA